MCSSSIRLGAAPRLPPTTAELSLPPPRSPCRTATPPAYGICRSTNRTPVRFAARSFTAASIWNATSGPTRGRSHSGVPSVRTGRPNSAISSGTLSLDTKKGRRTNLNSSSGNPDVIKRDSERFLLIPF